MSYYRHRPKARRMETAWYRPGPQVMGTQSGTSDGILLIGGVDSLMQQPSTAIDWGNKETWTILRILVKLAVVLTSTGVEEFVKYYWGLRLDELDADGSMRPVADMPSIVLTTTDSRREDWLWRDSTACLISATSGVDTLVQGSGGTPELQADVKPNRSWRPRTGLILHWHYLAVGSTSTNADAVLTGTADVQVLLGRRD